MTKNKQITEKKKYFKGNSLIKLQISINDKKVK